MIRIRNYILSETGQDLAEYALLLALAAIFAFLGFTLFGADLIEFIVETAVATVRVLGF